MTRTERSGNVAGPHSTAKGVLRQSLVGPEARVLLLEIDNAPLNGLTQEVRAALSAALAAEVGEAEARLDEAHGRAAADTGEAAPDACNRASNGDAGSAGRDGETLTRAPEGGETPGTRPRTGARPVVITGAAGGFSSATLVEAGAALRDGAPSLADLCRQIDLYPAPVVAAIAGRATGPGAELALACHARIMAMGARIQFPEAGLGLPPMAGASQRLPRLTGATEAIALLLDARPVDADQALTIGLADHVTEGDPVPAAVEFAARMPIPAPVIARDEGIRDASAFVAAIAQARRDTARNPMPAPARIIDCVEAALYLPPENGLALETVIFEDLLETTESRGLIAAARAERAAHALPAGVAAGNGEDIRVLGLTGAGPQLAALALLALGRGIRVIWAGPEGGGDEASLQRIAAWVRERLEAGARSGRMAQAQRDSDLLRFETGQPAQALAQAGLVVHARAGATVDALARQNPAALHLVIGGAPGRAGLTIAPSGRVCEISTGGVAGPLALAGLWRLMRGLGLQPVLSGGLPQIGRRVAAAGQAALSRMLAMGVPRRLIATALEGFGQAMPDLAEPEPGQAVRGMASDEVVRRWLSALANEGYRQIAEGSAPGPHAVDFLLVQGHGFPRWQGGPMHLAAERGAMVLRSELRRWQEDDPLWAPHPMLDLLVSKGRGVAA
ncbi:enoyl-CoA hydratase/isomerase family protein [Pseudogemmobacter bohemicus]|uniref:enoyl-CoA hydratase/isomerase family protein n=1 Tax=Pseudogemmobacter bohemicus TaxID=2250708 RepID=UPI0018E50E15|nr:enoyl-CoA hydratase/isomerase family protein [Pseudogemmobacter bohemicus]